MRFLTLALTATLANTLQIYEAETQQQDQDPNQHTGETGDQATYSLDEQEVEQLDANDEEAVLGAVEHCHGCVINITNYYDSEGQLED